MADSNTHESSRGRGARSPGAIPWRGWKDILLRTSREMANDHVSVIAAGVAFFGMLALFPALAALVSIYGLVADPLDVEEQLRSIGSLVPAAALPLIEDFLKATAGRQDMTLGWVAIIGIAGAMWSA